MDTLTDRKNILKDTLALIEDLESRLKVAEGVHNEPIAIIGMSFKFPGGAEDSEKFWTVLRGGVDAIREVPRDRWDIDRYYDSNPEAEGKLYTRHGGFLDAVDQFDAAFFGIAPREAVSMDPQHRLLLEVAWDALENSALVPKKLAGTHTGVFVGITSNDYVQLLRGAASAPADAYQMTGNCMNFAAGRIAYSLGFNGPTIALDTACSSSLVAVHLAVQSLRMRECNLALAGGVNLILSPEMTINACKARMLSPHGRCKTFDEAADGFVRSEGCGVIVLKRLSDAIASNDNILALIRGSAVNHDGQSSGLTVPNRMAQEAVIRQAIKGAGVEPSQVSYVEAHGTGTPLGDPIEVRALLSVYGRGRSPGWPLTIGSVKTNIGHLEAAAGIAGLIKVVLALQNGEIPPHIHFKKLNPGISFSDCPVIIPTKPIPWVTGDLTRLAGVSSFGASGTNAHVILEEAPARIDTSADSRRSFDLFCLSAKSEAALKELARRHENYLAKNSSVSLADVCFTANAGRSHFAHRLAIVAPSMPQLRDQLATFLRGREVSDIFRGEAMGNLPPKIVFLFTGQGSQYVGMGRQLYETSAVFRAALDRCAEVLRSHCDKPLLSVLYPKEGSDSSLDETVYTQPALFSLEYALAELWKSWGIEPSAVLGHSVGEYAAACVAGVFGLEDGLKLVAARGRLMQSLPRNGAMAVVFADEAEVAKVVATRARELSIAAINGPENVVVSGAQDAVELILNTFSGHGINNTILNVSHAFHSPLMEPMLDDFERAASAIAFAAPRIRLISNVTGQPITEKEITSAAYWRRHVREPVKFFAGMRTLHELGCNAFVEIGPQPILAGMARRSLPETAAVWLPSLRQSNENWQQILESLAGLYVRGADVDWPQFHRDCQCQPLRLPTYPFQRKRFWVEPKPLSTAAALPSDSTGAHPFLRHCTLSPIVKDIVVESQLGTSRFPYLDDHCIQGLKVVPLTAQVEMILAATCAALSIDSYVLRNLEFREPLLLSEEERAVQVVLTPGEEGRASFKLISVAARTLGGRYSWKVHAAGRIEQKTDGVLSEEQELVLETAKIRCREEVSATAYYQDLWQRGHQFGSSFRGIEKLWHSDGVSLGRIRLPAELEPELDRYEFHPALLDACLQVFAAACPELNGRPATNEPYLPFSLETFRLHKKPTSQLWSHVVIRGNESRCDETYTGDITILDMDGSPVAEVTGFVLRRTSAKTLRRMTSEHVADWFYEVIWKPLPLIACDSDISSTGSYLILADDRGVGVKLRDMLADRGQSSILVNAGNEYATLDDEHFMIDPARREHFSRLFHEAFKGGSICRGVVHLWNLNAHPLDGAQLDLHHVHATGTGSLLYLAQTLVETAFTAPPRLWMVTAGAREVGSQRAPVDLTQAPAWGLGKVVTLEHPELHCACIDLDPSEDGTQQLFEEICSSDQEGEIAFRHGVRYVARLARCANDGVNSLSNKEKGERRRLKNSMPGVLDGLEYEAAPRCAPARGEVEISVEATGLNFRDVLNALGMYPGDAGPLGGECAGTVAAVGEGVDDLKIGDAVVAIAPGAFSNFITAQSDLVLRKPDNVTFTEAATVPSAFLTAHYMLIHLARLSAGEKVLIHSAAGGVGLAAVQVAQRAGAEIFATAGSPEKREFLKRLGVEHVFNSRSLEFAEKISELTNRKGVDVVLNSLAGDFIPKSLCILNEKGRFLEIGKRDIWDEQRVAQFKKISAYHVVDLGETARDNPQLVGSVLREVMAGVRDGSLKPLPLRVFSSDEVVSAFRHMQQAKHIGKIVIVPRKLADLETVVAGVRQPASQGKFSGNATYLITGGLGGLGLCTVQWMAGSGAKFLVLMGRSAPSAEASVVLDKLEEKGVRVVVLRGDVARESDVVRVLSHIKECLPPLRGIVHSAAVLDDGALVQQSWARFRKVMAPKVDGAWLLHRLTEDLPLDFFVVYSSMASLLGSRGQGNYAAANAFLDALCRYRRALGLPATSIQWGPWSDIGVAASRGLEERLAAQGISSISPEQGLRALEAIFAEGNAEIAILAVDWSQYNRQFVNLGTPPLLRGLPETPSREIRQTSTAVHAPRILQALADAPLGQRRKLLRDYAAAQALLVLGLDSSYTIKQDQPLHELGLDSLMAVELRNLIGSGLGLKGGLPATLLFDYPTIESVVDYLLRDVLQWKEVLEPHGDSAKTPDEEESITDLAQLSEAAAEELLMQELESHRSTS